jgi:hypothetical protein
VIKSTRIIGGENRSAVVIDSSAAGASIRRCSQVNRSTEPISVLQSIAAFGMFVVDRAVTGMRWRADFQSHRQKPLNQISKASELLQMTVFGQMTIYGYFRCGRSEQKALRTDKVP